MPWPFMPSQCPSCRYFAGFEPYAEDDSGYRLPGVCRHPAIGMELFVPKDRPSLADATCELRWPRTSESLAALHSVAHAMCQYPGSPAGRATRLHASSDEARSNRGHVLFAEALQAGSSLGRRIDPLCAERVPPGLGGVANLRAVHPGRGRGLRDALTRIGGVQYWAKEMGLPGGDRPLGGVRYWTDEKIRATLAEFFGDRRGWPSQREFDEAGLHALREALRHYGGPERWAQEMGVVLPPGAARSTARPRAPAQPAEKPPRKWPPWTRHGSPGSSRRFWTAGRSGHVTASSWKQAARLCIRRCCATAARTGGRAGWG